MRKDRRFKTIPVFVLALFSLVLTIGAQADSARDKKQAQLDAACEQAREQKLAPLREQYVEECVQNKEQDSREACETFYADCGAQSGNRAPLFFDLPECVEAFEYQKSDGA